LKLFNRGHSFILRVKLSVCKDPYVFRVVPPPASLALGAGFVFSAAPAFSALGETANSQARHIATVFPEE
jgi:hypothetical protein